MGGEGEQVTQQQSESPAAMQRKRRRGNDTRERYGGQGRRTRPVACFPSPPPVTRAPTQRSTMQGQRLAGTYLPLESIDGKLSESRVKGRRGTRPFEICREATDEGRSLREFQGKESISNDANRKTREKGKTTERHDVSGEGNLSREEEVDWKFLATTGHWPGAGILLGKFSRPAMSAATKGALGARLERDWCSLTRRFFGSLRFSQ